MDEADPCCLHDVAAYVDTLRLVAVGRQMREARAMTTPIVGPHSPDGDNLGQALATCALRIGDQLHLTDFVVESPSYELRSWEGNAIEDPTPKGVGFTTYFVVEGQVELKFAGESHGRHQHLERPTASLAGAPADTGSPYGHPPLGDPPPPPQAPPAAHPMSILIKKRNCFEVVAMVDAPQEGGHWVLQPMGAVGLTIAPNKIAGAVWEEPRRTLGGHYAHTPNAYVPGDLGCSVDGLGALLV